MPFIPLNDPDQLPLDRHLLIEAGAGTGKTYTLESLVVRLLQERSDLSIENILVVTFTEKATSELKMRIRRKLSQVLAHQESVEPADPARHNLTRALDNFDQAAVHTIHGFCQTLLGDLAYENRVLFEHELVDDGPLLEELLQEDLRGYWPGRFGDAFSEVLALSAFGANPRRFCELVLKLARDVRQVGGHDRLRPDLGGQDYDGIRQALTQEIAGLTDFMGPAGSLTQEFGRLNINSRSRKSIITKIITPLEELIHGETESVHLLVSLRSWLAQTEMVKSQGRKGLACLIPDQWTKKGANPEAAPRMAELVIRLNRLVERLQALTHWLTQAAFARLRERAAALKRRKGLMSYDDMLSGVARALSPAQSGKSAFEMARQIRGRFPVAFVDEFQDTDPVQWQIFKALYLTPGGDEVEVPPPRLVLIGDPKQAIYAFRGADIYTYLQARQEMEALARDHRAGLYSLAVNWRSAPELVEGFNAIFGAAGGWFEDTLGAGLPSVGYQPLESAGAEQLPQQLQADAGGSALILVDLEGNPSATLAKVAWARWVAQEIRQLLIQGGLQLKDGPSGATRPLDPGDIALLVRGKNEVPPLEAALDELEIPFTYYKKPGLYESPEALHLSVLLEAIADPGDEGRVRPALLTFFFGIRRSQLTGYLDLPSHHPVKQRLYQWHRWADQGRWNRLFPALMEDSGVIQREAARPQWDRRETNLRQILEHLAVLAAAKGLDFRGVRALLAGYRQALLPPGEEGDLHQIDTDTPKVQIMTMHAAKGLQFPVVFLAGGFTRPPVQGDLNLYHEVDAQEGTVARIFDLDVRQSREAVQLEAELEDRRLLYVALTRAQFKLYLPFLPASNRAAWWGPVPRLLAPALSQGFPRVGASPAVAWRSSSVRPDLSPGEGVAADRLRPAVVLPDPLPALPKVPDFTSRRIQLSSFSSLHARSSAPGDGPNGGFQVEQPFAKEDDEDHRPEIVAQGIPPGEDPSSPMEELPGGAAVGSLLHNILERIDYQAVCRLTGGAMAGAGELPAHGDFRRIIEDEMALQQLSHLSLSAIARLITAPVVQPLDCVAPGFRLGDLNSADCCKEADFLFPWQPEERPGTGGGDPLELREGGLLRGYVDLIFRHGEKYYIVDFKSNFLPQGYAAPELAASMDEAEYHLQYKIYTVALLRSLKLSRGDDFDPRAHFGGILYLYLRGMARGGGQGIYHVQADRLLPWTKLENELLTRVREGK